MINNPLKINDYTSPVESTRQEFMKEHSYTDLKNFNTYKGFITEKDRIKSLIDKNVTKTESSYKQTISTKESTYRPKTQENSFNKSKLTLISKIADKCDTSTNSPPKTQNELKTLLDAINDKNPQTNVEKEYVREKLQKINENFSKRNEEGEDHFYLESQENYEEYCKFISSKNRIAVMRAIREKNIELLVEENFKMVKKKKKIRNNFYTHDNCSKNKNNNYKSSKDYNNKNNQYTYKNYNKEDEEVKPLCGFNKKRSVDINEDNLNSLKDFKDKKRLIVKNNLNKNEKNCFDLKEAKKNSDVETKHQLKTHFNAISVIANKLKQEELLKTSEQEVLPGNELKILGTYASNKAFGLNNLTKFDNVNTIATCNPKQNNFEAEVIKYLDLPESGFLKNQSRNVFTAKEKTKSQSQKDNYVFSPNYKQNKNPEASTLTPHKITDKKSFYKTLNNFMNHTGNNTLIKRITGKFNLQEAKLDMMESNPLVYNLSFNPLKEEVYKLNENPDAEQDQKHKLEYLKTIAFSDNNEKNGKAKRKVKRLGTRASNGEADFLFNLDNEINAYDENCDPSFPENIKKFDKIKTEISNKNQSKCNNNLNAGNNTEIQQTVHMEDCLNTKQNMDKIAKQILKKCNFIHEKNKNNNTRLFSGDGKMMITSGLTVREFKKKFKF